jgi:hypothetical protein
MFNCRKTANSLLILKDAHASRLVKWDLSVFIAIVFFITFFYLIPAMSWSQIGELKTEVAKGIVITYPENWSTSSIKYKNAIEFVTPPTGEAEKWSAIARILMTTEQRRDHADAVKRLAEIAKEVDAPTNIIEIGGWPALQRRYIAPVPRRGNDDFTKEARLSLRVTTAIAAEKLIVRLEGFLVPDADAKFADQAELIGRRVKFPSQGNIEQVQREITELKSQLPKPSSFVPPVDLKVPSLKDMSGIYKAAGLMVGTPVNVQPGIGELEVAVSNDGQNVVIGANSGYSNSLDRGATYTPRGGTPAPFPRDGDPSLASSVSGAFYYGFIGYPNGTPAANNVTGTSTGISVSTDNGVTFNFRNHAVVCPNNGAGMCFPDQEHIAADRVNSSPGGGDQVYSVWRNFAANVTPSIVCSQDSGNNWTAAAAVGAGDFPRITTGSDGFVYVVYRSSNNIMLNKFSSCSGGLAQQVGFPVTVVTAPGVTCPVPGLDRCNDGNTLSSHMVAVDDTNANHIYVAYATSSVAGTDDIVVRDSNDGGLTWPRSITVNSSATARRFMPWVCTMGSTAYVTWYDRRAATAASNDLTDYYLGKAFVSSGTLQAGSETNLSGNADPQCASGWPCQPRSQNDSESCSVQPQLAGRCSGSGAPCDFSTGGCPAGQTCNTGGGCPKYGDYNGNACASSRVYTAWASATAPTGLAAPANISIFSSTMHKSIIIDTITICKRYPFVCKYISICKKYPAICKPYVVFPEKYYIKIKFRDIHDRILIELDKICQYVIDCPGCLNEGLCPGYALRFENLPDAFGIKIYDSSGRQVFNDTSNKLTKSVKFTPEKNKNYIMIISPGKKTKIGEEYNFPLKIDNTLK